MLFPVWSIRPFITIIRYLPSGPRTAASNCGRCHGGYTGWCGSENSRRGVVGEITGTSLDRLSHQISVLNVIKLPNLTFR